MNVRMKKKGEVTQSLDRWRKGDEQALNDLMQLIYDDLRRRANGYLRRERPGHTLQSSALVHEAYLRLVDQQYVQWRNRAHFYAIAAQMMRRILANHARDRLCAKRGGGAEHLPLDECALPAAERLAEQVAVDDALTCLASVNPHQAKVVELFYFGGLRREEIAHILDVSIPTVARRLQVAKAWLFRHLNRQKGSCHAAVRADHSYRKAV